MIKEHIKNILNQEPSRNDGITLKQLELREKELNIILPNALKEYYNTVGNISLFMDGFNHFATPNEWQIVDNKLLFLEENQAVVYWAVELKEPFKLYETTNLSKPIWDKVSYSLEGFLEMMLYFQTIMSGQFKFSAMWEWNADELLTAIQKSWDCRLHYEELAVYQKDNTLALCLFNEENQIFLTSRDEDFFKRLMDKYQFCKL